MVKASFLSQIREKETAVTSITALLAAIIAYNYRSALLVSVVSFRRRRHSCVVTCP